MECHEHGVPRAWSATSMGSATSKECYEQEVLLDWCAPPDLTESCKSVYFSPIPHPSPAQTQQINSNRGKPLSGKACRHSMEAFPPSAIQLRPPADCCRAVEMINGIKFAVSGAAQDNLGIAADEVGLHSVHSSLALAKEPGYTIMLVGRWPCLH